MLKIRKRAINKLDHSKFRSVLNLWISVKGASKLWPSIHKRFLHRVLGYSMLYVPKMKLIFGSNTDFCPFSSISTRKLTVDHYAGHFRKNLWDTRHNQEHGAKNVCEYLVQDLSNRGQNSRVKNDLRAVRLFSAALQDIGLYRLVSIGIQFYKFVFGLLLSIVLDP